MPFGDSGPKYRDRSHAGQVLAAKLGDYSGNGTLILAIPNGGVPVGAEIAKVLEVELYLMLVRKLQFPDNPEAGFGALTSDGYLLLNHPLIEQAGLSQGDIQRQKEKAEQSIRSREERFGEWARLPPLKGRRVYLVDDGLASGFTMEAAVKSAREQGASSVVVAVPTSSLTAHRRLEPLVERVVCPDVSRLRIFAVANSYAHWYDLDEDEVMEILRSLRLGVDREHRSGNQ